jgi:pyruvate dehydrogenase E1 component alpha subunit
MTATEIDRARALALLSEMIRVRRFEERAAELYTVEKIRGFLHLCIGEEAISAGAMSTLRSEDNIVSTYREHGHALARGITARAVMAEMFGKTSGCSGGRGGSMHLFSREHRFWGGNAIVAGGLPLAIGLALADKQLGRTAVTACFFGDGAVAEGEFHESLNLAALWRLPVVFLCENNLYAMGTAIARYQAQMDLCRKAEADGVPGLHVDGMDVEAVATEVAAVAERVRSGAGPQFVELHTYRFRAHSMFDPQLYRSKDEVEAWRQRDPITLLTNRMRERAWIDEATLERIETSVGREIDDAVEFAEQSSWEPIEDLLIGVTSDGGTK